METAVLAILKSLAGDNIDGMQFWIIIGIIIFLLLYKYFIKPMMTEAKRIIDVINTQNKNIQDLNKVVERMDERVGELKVSSDEGFTVNQLKIDEAQRDIAEMKSILSQFKGAMLYNSRLFNKELI